MAIWTSLREWLHSPTLDSFEDEMNTLDGDREILKPLNVKQSSALPMGIYQPSSTGDQTGANHLV